MKKKSIFVYFKEIMLLIWITCFSLIIIIGLVILYNVMFYREKFSNELSKLHVYCISLYDADDRKKTMNKTYKSFPFYLQFIDAVDTRSDRWKLYTSFLEEDAIYRIKQAIKRRIRQSHFDLTPGAVGCFLSHMKVWTIHMQTLSKEPCLIFEDDSSKPSPSFINDLEYILKKWPSDYDIVFLNYQIFGNTKFTDRSKRFKILSRNSYFFLTNCYLITRSGIIKILKILETSQYKFSIQIDAYLSRLIQNNNIKACFWHECICPQDNNTPTSIQIYSALGI